MGSLRFSVSLYCSFKYNLLVFGQSKKNKKQISPPICSVAFTSNLMWHQRRREPISLHHHRGKNSGSVITLSRAIKPLPLSDRWQMLEGLFIFCLLIRAARRGGMCRWGMMKLRRGGGVGGGWRHYKRNTLFQPEEAMTLAFTLSVICRDFFPNQKKVRREWKSWEISDWTRWVPAG